MDTPELNIEDVSAHAAPAPEWRRTRAAIDQRAAWIEEYLGEGWVELEPGIYSRAGSPQAEPAE